MYIKKSEKFYLPILYDYYYLKKNFLEAKKRTISDSITFPVYDDSGNLIDNFRDSLPFPNVVHILQTSVAFFEKSLKYILSLYCNQKIEKTHDLGLLWHKIQKVDQKFSTKMRKDIREYIDKIKQIDYTTLRYFDKESKEIEIDFKLLKDLIEYTFNYLGNIRIVIYKNQDKLNEVRKNTTRISFRGKTIKGSNQKTPDFSKLTLVINPPPQS